MKTIIMLVLTSLLVSSSALAEGALTPCEQKAVVLAQALSDKLYSAPEFSEIHKGKYSDRDGRVTAGWFHVDFVNGADREGDTLVTVDVQIKYTDYKKTRCEVRKVEIAEVSG